MSYENAWQYDAAGNRSVTTYKRATVEAPNTLASVTTIASVYTGNDWLKQQTSTVATAGTTNATTTFYGYDRNGAQTNERVGAAGAVEVNDWQFDGTLASTVTQGQATGGSEFTYDVGGNRLKQRTQIGKPEAKEVRYLVDPNTSYAQVVQERDENNVLQARYAWEDGLAPLVMWRRAQNGDYAAFFYLCDGQDSVRQLSDASGRVTDSYFYDAFGNALQGGSGDTPNSFRYTGQQLDPSGDYYLRARYYNSGSGRFLGQDILPGDENDPISLHRYVYAANNGVSLVDPSGLYTEFGPYVNGPWWEAAGHEVNDLVASQFVLEGQFLGRDRWANFSFSSFQTDPGFSGNHYSKIWDFVDNGKLKRPGGSLPKLRGIAKNWSLLKPDLVDFDEKAIFDVTSVKQAPAKAAKVQMYVNIFNLLDPTGGWHAGNASDGFVPSPMVGPLLYNQYLYATVSPPLAGVIAYSLIDTQDRRRPAGARARYAWERVRENVSYAPSFNPSISWSSDATLAVASSGLIGAAAYAYGPQLIQSIANAMMTSSMAPGMG